LQLLAPRRGLFGLLASYFPAQNSSIELACDCLEATQ
jgi:hypothetical protein